MNRAILSVSFIALLAACDGNPLDPLPGAGGGTDTPGDTGGIVGGDGGADGGETDNCSATGVVCTGEVNIFNYANNGTPGALAAADDTITINNLPFDLGGTYSYVGVESFTVGLNTYNIPVFENDAGDEVYVALYIEGDTVGAGAVATDGYVDFGYGGVVMRSSGATIPTEGEATFTGAYGGIRVSGEGAGAPPPLTLVTGQARMRIDLEDFDVVGAIDGFVSDRFTVEATPQALPPITIATTGFDGIQIAVTSAEEVVADDEVGASGTFAGLFGGDIAAGSGEIAGIIIMQGGNFLDDDYTVLERGAFVATQDGPLLTP